ncbi:MAG: response regulator [Bdellovibrionales bacterium]|nr:response regulator [Bdellovibrionales bacterium]
MGNNNEVRILIVDQEVTSAKKLMTYLNDSGFKASAIYDGENAGQKIMETRPHFILVDLTMPNFTAFDCLKFLNSKQMIENNEVRVIVLSHHNAQQNVEACLSQGAHDYVVKPAKPIDVLTRIALHLQARKRVLKVEETEDKNSRDANYYLRLVELLAKTITLPTPAEQVHYQLIRMLAFALNAVRISLITFDDTKPTVIASSDKEDFARFELQIEKYPEIDYVLRTQKPLFIESLKDDAMLSFVKDNLKAIHFNTMIVLPIISNGFLRGIISARFEVSSNLNDAEIRLCQIVPQLIAAYWRTMDVIPAKSKTKAS